jgi:hypothetical protein
MPTRVERRTVNLSAYPDLVVIYLGMRVNRIAGIKTLLGFGPKISSSAAAQPDALLRHETFIYSLFPMHVGMRQYWRDTNSLLEWTRSDPHRQWWQSFLKDSGGTGFWHETYFRRGGIEAVYDDVPENIGLMAFAPVVPARGPMFGELRGPKRNLESHRYCPRRSSTAGQKHNGAKMLENGSQIDDACERCHSATPVSVPS